MKIIAIFTAMCILLCQSAFANQSASSEAMLDVCSYQIMVGDEDGNLNLDKIVTRAEFTAVISRLIGIADASVYKENAEQTFDDVKPTDWFFGYVELLCGMGIMNGISNDHFAPNDYVTYEQAMKTLVCALGYESGALRDGGYPNGYIKQGTSLRLNKGVNFKDGFTRGCLMQMVYNALDVQQLNMYGEKDVTLRTLHQDGITLRRGIVTANYDTYLNTPNSKLKRDEVEIDDVTYYAGGTDVALYLGMCVEFYAKETGGYDEIISVRNIANINTVTTVYRKDIVNINKNEIRYYDEDKTRTLDISRARLVKNGRIILAHTDSDLILNRGYFKFTDNDADRKIDLIFMEDYTNVRVKNIKNESIEFEIGSYFNSGRYLTLEEENENIHFNISSANGKAMKLSDISPDSIISISADENSRLYKLVVSEKKLDGKITASDDDGIYIDGIFYPVYECDAFSAELGDFVTVFLDYCGYVADIEEKEEMQHYAFVLGFAKKGAVSSKYEVKMLVGANPVFEYDESDDADSTDLIPVIHCQNGQVSIKTMTKKFKVDGVKIENESDLPPAGLYSYKQNEEGEITELIPAQESCGGNDLFFNQYDKVFYDGSKEPVAIDENTVVLCIPERGNRESDSEWIERLFTNTNEEDFMVPLEISNKTSGVSFDVFGYDIDEETKKCRAIAFHTVMSADNTSSVNTSSGPIGMIGKSRVVIDEDGAEKRQVTLITKSGEETYVLADIVSGKNDVLGTLKLGDLVYYEIGLTGKIDDAYVIHSFAENREPFSSGSGTQRFQILGSITDIDYDKPEITTGNLSTIVSIETPSGNIPVTVYQRNAPPIFVYEVETKQISPATISDLIPGGANERTYALIPLGGASKVLVICR